MATTIKYILPHSTQFKDKWEEWIKYRTELKKPYKTQTGVTKALNKLGSMSEQDAISAIEYSMSQEYQGLFEEKKKKEKGETDKTYTEPTVKKLSSYKPKEYDQTLAIQHMRDKLKKNYEQGTYLKDWGDVYTSLLRHLIKIPQHVKNAIVSAETEESERKRNRFEPQYEGRLDSNIRDRKLNYWLDQQRNEGIRVYEKI